MNRSDPDPQQKLFLSSRKFNPDPGSGFFPSRIPDQEVKIAPDPGSRSATLTVSNRPKIIGKKIAKGKRNVVVLSTIFKGGGGVAKRREIVG